MTRTIQEVFERAVAQIGQQMVTILPPLLVGVAVLTVAVLLAGLARKVCLRLFKGDGVDQFLSESGFGGFLPGTKPVRVAPVLARSVYWAILTLGVLTAINAFDTKLTTQIVEGLVFLFPKLVGAGAILLAGVWLAQFFGRSVLLWASNEGIPHPRRVAAGVRVAVVFVAVVVCADLLGFAERVFFAAFLIFAGGATLACSLAVGLGAADTVRRWMAAPHRERDEDTLLRHL